jgi:MoaA/NifB/PqqE/SkfB family radical SAM enzyme
VPICVVTKDNLDALEELFPLAESLDVRIHFQPLCTGAEITRGESSPDLTQRYQLCFARLLKAKRSGAPIASSSRYLEYLSQWHDFSRSALFDPKFRCAAGYAFLYVDHEGRGYPCPYLKGKVPGISLITQRWQEHFTGATPCTRCAVGPMVEFNLLYSSPHRTLGDLYRGYRGFGLA